MFGLILFGAIGFSRMGISQMPDVDFPVLTVIGHLAGRLAGDHGVRDRRRARGLGHDHRGDQEHQLGLARGPGHHHDRVRAGAATSTSRSRRCRRRYSRPSGTSPRDIDPPIVTKSNPEDNPIMFTTLSGPGALRDKVLFVRDHLKDAMTTVAGVGDVRLGGYVDPNMRIWLDADAMARQEITVDDIIATIQSQHTLTPSGYIDERAPRDQRAGPERGEHARGIRGPDHQPPRRPAGLEDHHGSARWPASRRAWPTSGASPAINGDSRRGHGHHQAARLQRGRGGPRGEGPDRAPQRIGHAPEGHEDGHLLRQHEVHRGLDERAHLHPDHSRSSSPRSSAGSSWAPGARRSTSYWPSPRRSWARSSCSTSSASR